MNTTNQIILLAILKDFSTSHTASSLAKLLHKSRWGIWKNLREMELQELINIRTAGTGKTSTNIITIRWNSFTEKTLAFSLAQEASKYKRWQFTFSKVEHSTEFFILYGSILHSSTTAGDIDILSTSKEKNIAAVRESIQIIQKIQEKKIHFIHYTQKELIKEIKNSNKIFLDALKKGIVLFGEESFIRFIKRFHQ